MREIFYRSYQPGDELNIVTFFNECGYHTDLQFWQWANKSAPFGQTLIELAMVGSRIIGNYSVLPRLLWISNEPVMVGMAIHVAVHPQYRGLMVLQELEKRIVAQCQQAQYPFITGFPNENVWLVYLKLFGWKPITDLVAFEKPLKHFVSPMNKERKEGRIIDPTFDSRYDQTELRSLVSLHNSFFKDHNYLNWRYRDHPKVKYKLFEIGSSRQLDGYFILKLFTKNNLLYGHIVDLAFTHVTIDLFPLALDMVLDWFSMEKVDVVSCWMQEGAPFFQPMQEAGFTPTGFTTHLGYKSLDLATPPDKSVTPDGWYILMGDSDTF